MITSVSQRNDHVSMSDLIELHARHLRASGKAQDTIDARVEVIARLHADLPFGVAYASGEEIEEWLGHDDWSQWTRCTYAMHIRGFYGWADGRYLAGDPTSGMAKPKTPDSVPRPVTDDELAHALEVSENPFRRAIILAAYAGLRAQECCRLDREDVTAELVRIRKAKGGSPATVDTHSVLWSEVRDAPPGPLLIGPNGGRLNRVRLSGQLGRYLAARGLPGVTLHRFRHWYGTALLKGGADLRTVQEAMRHKSVSSTQGYTLVESGQRRLAIQSLPALDNRKIS